VSLRKRPEPSRVRQRYSIFPVWRLGLNLWNDPKQSERHCSIRRTDSGYYWYRPWGTSVTLGSVGTTSAIAIKRGTRVGLRGPGANNAGPGSVVIDTQIMTVAGQPPAPPDIGHYRRLFCGCFSLRFRVSVDTLPLRSFRARRIRTSVKAELHSATLLPHWKAGPTEKRIVLPALSTSLKK